MITTSISSGWESFPVIPVLSKLLTKLDKAPFSFHCGKATQHDVLRHSFFDWGGAYSVPKILK